MSQDNYSTPKKPGSGGSVIVTQEVGKNFTRFSARDSFRNFQPFPLAFKKIGTSDIITCAINSDDDFYKRFATSNLGRNLDSSGYTEIFPLSRPSLKSAYLHSLAFGVYDAHQIVPMLVTEGDLPAGVISLQSNNYETSNGLEESNGYVVGYLPYPSAPRDLNYYGVYNPSDSSRTVRYASYEYAFPFNPFSVPLITRWAKQHEMLWSGKTAPRSGITFGMLPNDWFANNFEITIYGERADNSKKIIWDNHGRTTFEDANQAHSYSKTNDEFVPANYNEINRLIDADIVNLFVMITRPFFYVPVQASPIYKPVSLATDGTLNSNNPVDIWTVAKMPVKVDFTVLYA